MSSSNTVFYYTTETDIHQTFQMLNTTTSAPKIIKAWFKMVEDFIFKPSLIKLE